VYLGNVVTVSMIR